MPGFGGPGPPPPPPPPGGPPGASNLPSKPPPAAAKDRVSVPRALLVQDSTPVLWLSLSVHHGYNS